MFIAVLNDVYIALHKQHKQFWERHMTGLMIKDIIKSEQKVSTTGDLIGRALNWLFQKIGLYSALSSFKHWLYNTNSKETAKDMYLDEEEDENEYLDDISEEDTQTEEEEEESTASVELSDISNAENQLKKMQSLSLAHPDTVHHKKEKLSAFTESQIEGLVFDFYNNRSSENLETIKKDIQQLRKELVEIKDLMSIHYKKNEVKEVKKS